MTEHRAIDVYSHILPLRYYERLRQIAPDPRMLKRWLELPMLYDLDMRTELMATTPRYQQVLTLSSPPIEQLGDAELGREMAQLANDSMAALVQEHPGLFPAWVAALPLQSPSGAQHELERALSMGARGVQLFTNVNGAPLDSAGLEAIFAAMNEAELPIWLHPTRGPNFSDYTAEASSRYEIWWAFGWPYETSAAVARLVFSGVFERHPGLKLITHHLGAMIPFFEGRIRHGWDQMGSRTADDDLADVKGQVTGPPIDVFKGIYADTAISGSAIALRCGLDFFGTDHVLFGTDFPFDRESGAIFIRETLAAVDGLAIDQEAKDLILSGNAVRLLLLDDSGLSPRTG